MSAKETSFEVNDVVSWTSDFGGEGFGRILFMGDVPVRPMPEGGYSCAWVKTAGGGASIDLSRLTKWVKA